MQKNRKKTGIQNEKQIRRISKNLYSNILDAHSCTDGDDFLPVFSGFVKIIGARSGVISRITELFHITLTQHTVRKTAHALEYAALCFLFSCSWQSVFLKSQHTLSFLSAALYASSDELHQYFVSGRACQPRDILVDCLGASFGLLAFFIIYTVYTHIHKNKAR